MGASFSIDTLLLNAQREGMLMYGGVLVLDSFNHNIQSSNIRSRAELGYNQNMQSNDSIIRSRAELGYNRRYYDYVLDSFYNHNMQNNNVTDQRGYVFGGSVDLDGDGGVSRVDQSTTQESFQNLEEVTIEAESSSITEDCSICLGEIGSRATGLPCSHLFHRYCITKWLTIRNTCPLCRCSVLSRNH